MGMGESRAAPGHFEDAAAGFARCIWHSKSGRAQGWSDAPAEAAQNLLQGHRVLVSRG